MTPILFVRLFAPTSLLYFPHIDAALIFAQASHGEDQETVFPTRPDILAYYTSASTGFSCIWNQWAGVCQ
ncbi:hypothetical protein DESC_370031 [Desulfosarcina cetonica]|nr:hypothetical protein DESC_370031 [Desulfosarcina cetonica]